MYLTDRLVRNLAKARSRDVERRIASKHFVKQRRAVLVKVLANHVPAIKKQVKLTDLFEFAHARRDKDVSIASREQDSAPLASSVIANHDICNNPLLQRSSKVIQAMDFSERTTLAIVASSH